MARVSNKALVAGENQMDFLVVSSRQDVLSAKVFCVFDQKINDQQRVLVQRIVEELEMIYALFSLWRGIKAVEVQYKIMT